MRVVPVEDAQESYMNRKWLSIVVLVAAAGVLSALSSCGHSQELVSIQIQPTSETIGASNIPVSQDANAQVQLRALGTYIHPPVTKDITNQVTWASNDAQMFSVNSTGMLTATGEACGGTLVSATVTTNTQYGRLVVVRGGGDGVHDCERCLLYEHWRRGRIDGGSDSDLCRIADSGTVTSSPPGLICCQRVPAGQFANWHPGYADCGRHRSVTIRKLVRLRYA